MLNQYGIELIKSFERCRLTSYDDGSGYWTIGWGHTTDKFFTVVPNLTITKDKADELLRYDIEQDAIPLLNRELLYENELTSNQYSALISLVYNSGSLKIKRNGKWIPSPLMIALNNKEDASELIKTHDIHSAGIELLGLKRRRLCEYWLYINYMTKELSAEEWAKYVRVKCCNVLT